MPNTIKIKRGVEANRLSITPQSGELIFTTDTKKVYVGDGTTAGGNPVGATETAIGTIQYFTDLYSLDNKWLLANGGIVAKASYPDLYNVVGSRRDTNAASWSRSVGIGKSPFSGMAYGNSTFVAVGGQGTIITSTDGQNWVRRASFGTNVSITGVAFANSLFCLIISGVPYTSSDGITWTQRTLISTDAYYITAANNLFFASGSNGFVATSSDGITWTTRSIGTTDTICAAAFGGGTYVVVGGAFGSSAAIYSSTNLTSWTNRSPSSVVQLTGVARSGSIFVAVGTSGGVIWSSPDGATWTSRNSGTSGFRGIVFGGSTFVAFGDSASEVRTSTDGITWTARTSNAANSLSAGAYGNSSFIIGGQNGVMVTSTDGITWTLLARSYTGTYFVNNVYIVCGSSGLLTSTDGMTWAPRSVAGATVYAVAYGAGLYVAVSTSGAIYTSPDLTTWTSRTSGVANNITDVTFGNGRFIANSGTAIISSTDGITWSTVHTATETIFCVAFGGGTFIAAGGNGSSTSVYYSTNGTTWTKSASSPGSGNILDVAYINGIFVGAIGSPSTVVRSTNLGVTWGTVSTGQNTWNFNSVGADADAGMFILGGDYGRILTSTDNGSTWVSRLSVGYEAAGQFYDVASGSDYYFAIADNGLIWVSSPFTYNAVTDFVLPNGRVSGMAGQKPYVKALAG